MSFFCLVFITFKKTGRREYKVRKENKIIVWFSCIIYLGVLTSPSAHTSKKKKKTQNNNELQKSTCLLSRLLKEEEG